VGRVIRVVAATDDRGLQNRQIVMFTIPADCFRGVRYFLYGSKGLTKWFL